LPDTFYIGFSCLVGADFSTIGGVYLPDTFYIGFSCLAGKGSSFGPPLPLGRWPLAVGRWAVAWAVGSTPPPSGWRLGRRLAARRAVGDRGRPLALALALALLNGSDTYPMRTGA
jgi:hypothetical protein